MTNSLPFLAIVLATVSKISPPTGSNITSTPLPSEIVFNSSFKLSYPIDISAPLSLAIFCFSSLDATAITLAPIILPICIAANPVEPDAPKTTSNSPF